MGYFERCGPAVDARTTSSGRNTTLMGRAILPSIQLIAGFTPARTGRGSEAMWRERPGAVRVVKKFDLYVIFSASLSGLQMKLT
jgi:hypothetical protein